MKYFFRLVAVLVVCLKISSGLAWAAVPPAIDAPILLSSAPQLNRPYYTLSGGWQYTLVHQVTVRNTDNVTVFDIEVIVPLMDLDTPLYMQMLHEQLLPWPSYITYNAAGRRVAVYQIDRLDPGAELVLSQRYLVNTNSINYVDLLAFGGTDFSAATAAAHYLQPAINIQSNHEEIREFALAAVTQAAGVEQNPFLRARQAFAAVNLHMTFLRDQYANDSALGALRRGTGVCEDFANLYVATLRALGIPARIMNGYLFQPQDHMRLPYLDAANSRINLAELAHNWVEFYLPDLGWVVADPTFTFSFISNGEIMQFINWDYFARITDERRYIFFREGNEPRDQVIYQTSGGNLQVSLGYFLYLGDRTALFNDAAGHWAEAEIAYLFNFPSGSLMQGIGGGLFGVNHSLTRAQLAVTLQRQINSPAAMAQFVDLHSEHWAFAAIGAAQAAGWLSGYPDATFRPEQAVTRAELAQVLVNIFELQLPPAPAEDEPTAEEDDTSVVLTEEPADDEEVVEAPTLTPAFQIPEFRDLGQPGLAWADEAILILAGLGLAQGTGEGYFQPERTVTRAEFAALLTRTLIYVEKLTMPPMYN